MIAIAKAGAPAGLVVHSAGAGGIIVAFIDAFNGLDGTLLLAAGLVVIVILLFVYRSPILWFFPLFSAALALGAASLVIYTARQERHDHAQRAEPGHPVGARDRRRHRLRVAADQPLSARNCTSTTSPLARDDRGLAGAATADRRLGRHRHPRPALPDLRRPQLDRRPRPGVRDRHRLHGGRDADVPAAMLLFIGGSCTGSGRSAGCCSSRTSALPHARRTLAVLAEAPAPRPPDRHRDARHVGTVRERDRAPPAPHAGRSAAAS